MEAAFDGSMNKVAADLGGTIRRSENIEIDGFPAVEIGGYEQLRRVAERAGDEETAAMANGILEQERAAAGLIAGAFDRAAAASLDAVGATS